MAVRKSQHSLAKMGKVGRKAFMPDLKEWTEACEVYVYDEQIFKHFFISRECFYAFIDRQRVLIDEGKKSAYIDAYEKGRNKSRQWAISTLKTAAQNGDTGAIIFSSKAIGGLLEAKDIKHIELKKLEVEMKQKFHNLNVDEFLLKISERFNLKEKDKAELQRMSEDFRCKINVEVDSSL